MTIISTSTAVVAKPADDKNVIILYITYCQNQSNRLPCKQYEQSYWFFNCFSGHL